MENQEPTVKPQDQQIAKTPAFSAAWAIRAGIIISAIGLSFMLFFVALLLPAFNLSNGDTFPALTAFLFGWSGALGWYANVFLPVAWLGLATSNFRPSLYMSLVSTILGIGLALCSMLLKTILLDEGGAIGHITSMGSGFYVWLGSFVVCLVADLALVGYDFLRSDPSHLSGKPRI